jgi:16S rRNA (cytosine967-C5)-methyltransferase
MIRSESSRGRAALRLRYASELWRQYVASDGPLPQLDRWLAAALRQYPKFGRQDRRAYSELLFAAVRFAYLAAFVDFARQRLDAGRRNGLVQHLAASVDPFGTLFAAPEDAVGAIRRMPPEIVFHVAGRRYLEEGLGAWPLEGLPAMQGDRRLDRLLDALCRWRAADASIAAKLLWQGVPLRFAEPLAARAARSGWNTERTDAFLAAQARKPPLWLRLNHPERGADVLRELERHALQAVAYGQAIRVTGERGIYELDAYRSGAIEIQDWASQQIGGDVAVKPGELAWDACAGGGGKSVQLAAALANRGAVYASDIREYKLGEVRRRAVRAGFHNVRTLTWSGGEPPSFGREVVKQQGFHWVLVDAPCSSTGTWRRNPDARFRSSPGSLSRLTSLQLRLLENAATAVRAESGLVYSTCSWLVEENEAVVERFLTRNPRFRLDRASLHGCPAADADTMFSAVMIRTS